MFVCKSRIHPNKFLLCTNIITHECVCSFITRIGVWMRGKDESCSFRGVVWNSTRNSVVCQTGSQTASSAAFAIGNSLKYEADVSGGSTFYAAGALHIGFTRNPNTNARWSSSNKPSAFSLRTVSSRRATSFDD